MDHLEKAQVAVSYPSPFGYAVFVSCPSKSFVIYMDKCGGSAVERALNGISGERPLTHEFVSYILEGLEASIKDVVIYKEEEGTYYARLTLSMKNELGEKMVEIDSRPSDALTMAIRHKAPVYVEREVLEKVEDVSQVLEEIKKKNVL